MKIKCTENDYERLLKAFHEIKEKPYEFVPTKWDLERHIIPNLKNWFLLLLWIDEMGIETENNKAIRKDIRRIIDETFVITEEEPVLDAETQNNTKQ